MGIASNSAVTTWENTAVYENDPAGICAGDLGPLPADTPCLYKDGASQMGPIF
jgi:hypothetical protein